jgi:diguanylate cyclase (GGDEF)-like protein
VDWSKLPDLSAVALLTCAFASVAKRGHTSVSRLWLTGWMLISLHFLAFMFMSAQGILGVLATDIGLASLSSAGLLFMWAAVPYRKAEPSSRNMIIALLGTCTLYVILIATDQTPPWALNLAAMLVGLGPLAVAVTSLRKFKHVLRWVVVGLYLGLSVFLLLVQNRPGNGADLALNAVLFTVYFGCCVHVWYNYRRATAGALITIVGFFGWASVFVFAPLADALLPKAQFESEVWNLPKYVVAVGMILLLLEDQIDHNRFLALHDELTGLPNRRLFLDRLALSLERARRSESKAALLVVDLDRFKQVNDTLGHHAGDLLLQKVSTIFSSRVRRSDTVARTGGDEFSLILEEPTNRSNANRVAQSLMELLREPMRVGEHFVQVGASIGVALFPDDAANLEALCIAADLRMYDYKHVSKDGINLPIRPAALPVASPLPPIEVYSDEDPIAPDAEMSGQNRVHAG